MVQPTKDTITNNSNNIGQKTLSKSRRQIPSSPGISMSIRHQSQTN